MPQQKDIVKIAIQMPGAYPQLIQLDQVSRHALPLIKGMLTNVHAKVRNSSVVSIWGITALFMQCHTEVHTDKLHKDQGFYPNEEVLCIHAVRLILQFAYKCNICVKR